MSDKSAQELAEEVSKPGKFSFIDRLQGRNYPKDDVVVYLDEELGYRLLDVQRRMEGDDNHTPSIPEMKLLEKEHARLSAALRDSKYTIHLQGISNEDWDAIVDDAAEHFPYEYEETTNPFTGAKTKEVIQSQERSEYFTKMLWLKFIQSIEDSEGNVDSDISLGTISAFRKQAPFSAIARVSETIDKLRMATDWVEYVEDEDFLAKP